MLEAAIIGGGALLFLMMGFVLYCCLKVYDNSERKIKDYQEKKKKRM